MQVINSLSQIKTPFKNAVVTIGNFDGVHLGHQALLRKTVAYAAALNGTSVAITFTPHPVDFFHKKHRPYIITPLEQKLELMAGLGLDVTINIPFNTAFTQISAQTFLEEILLKTIGMRAIVAGKDYSFGHNRAGNLQMLKDEAGCLGFEVVVMDWVSPPAPNGRQISSSVIREMIRHANLVEAAQLLGRPFRVQSVVTHGDRRGAKLLNIPTANIEITNQLYPPHGIYAGTAQILNRRYLAAIYIGAPSTFNADNVRVETHLIDASPCLDLYGQTIKIDFIRFLRKEIKFNNTEDLKHQIQQDIDNVKNLITVT